MTIVADVRGNFRDDINGLRALAVVGVILYHFRIPGFSGGFVGVDIFFAISGFLMTGIVVKGLEQGRFSLIGFYVARARRIVPALVGLCAILLCLGWFALLPSDYKTLSTHVIASLGFFSNIKYWKESGYFDLASHDKWLLHTWSLSVEWQFYLILPIVLWVVWHLRPGRAVQARTILVALVVSLAVSVLITDTDPAAAFFSFPTRAWELLGGGLVVLYAENLAMSAACRRWLEAFGLGLILVSIAAFDSSSAWPGWRALVPVVATVMVLLAARSPPWTGNRVTQWLGGRSYSLYLWHWPSYVALVYAELQDDYLAISAGILVTLILGNLSYLWIENPSRRLLVHKHPGVAATVLLSVVMVFMTTSMLIRSHEGVVGRFPPAAELVAEEANNFNPRRDDCHPNKGRTSPSCVWGGADWKVIAIGDSHADAIITSIVLAKPVGDAGVVQWSYSGCPFVQGARSVRKINEDYQCTEFNEWVRSRLDVLPKSIPILIIGRYAKAALGKNEDRLPVDVPEIYFSKVYQASTPQFLNEFAQHITVSACQLAKERPVYMLRPIPEMGIDVPKAMSRRMALGLGNDISISIEQYRKRNAWVWAAQDAARDKCGVKILDPIPYLCHGGRCYGTKDGRPLYRDSDHLSEFGNKLLMPIFVELFQTQ